MPTCTAPTTTRRLVLDADGDPDFEQGWACDWTAEEGEGCSAPAPHACQGPTTWPPPTAHQTYAEDRRLGQRVPPSVSTWRPEDVRRQQEADARIRARASERPTAAGAWGPGPSCDSGVQS